MKRVKMLACMAGSGFTRNVGEIVAVPEDEAGRLIAAGFATDAPAAPSTPPTAPTAPEIGGTVTTDKKDEQPKRRGRPPANRETPAPAAPSTPPPVEPPASETPAGAETPSTPPSEPPAVPPS